MTGTGVGVGLGVGVGEGLGVGVGDGIVGFVCVYCTFTAGELEDCWANELSDDVSSLALAHIKQSSNATSSVKQPMSP